MRDRIRANLKFSAISLLVLAIVSYTYFETCEVIRGPVVEIDSPQNGYSTTDETVQITGKVKNISYMFLNGRPIFADSSGVFREQVILSEGYNSIFIEARDRIGKKKEKTLEMVFNRPKNTENMIEGLVKEDSVSNNL